MFDVAAFRRHFPQLDTTVQGGPLVYLDNAASSLRHRAVIDRIQQFDSFEAANVHRGAHELSRRGTESYERAREQVQRFVNARTPEEIVFVRGTTEGINLVASSFVETYLQPGDEVVISPFEHHSNIVPMQMACAAKGLKLKVMKFSKDEGLTDLAIDEAITDKTRFVSVVWYSNSFGHRLPIEKIIQRAHAHGAKVLIDAAQTPSHEQIDVQKLDCDFLTFSGHKIFGPYGIGALFGKSELLKEMPPYQTGGSMIDRVTFLETIYADIPQKFEAGTPNVTGAIGLGVACELVANIGVANWHQHLSDLRQSLLEQLRNNPELKVYEFPAEQHSGVVSFTYKGAHPSDVGTLLDHRGIAVRAGHHCTQPTMALLGIEGTVRASLAPYNTQAEVDKFCQAVAGLKEFFND